MFEECFIMEAMFVMLLIEKLYEIISLYDCISVERK